MLPGNFERRISLPRAKEAKRSVQVSHPPLPFLPQYGQIHFHHQQVECSVPTNGPSNARNRSKSYKSTQRASKTPRKRLAKQFERLLICRQKSSVRAQASTKENSTFGTRRQQSKVPLPCFKHSQADVYCDQKIQENTDNRNAIERLTADKIGFERSAEMSSSAKAMLMQLRS